MKVKKEDVLTFDGNCFHFNKSAFRQSAYLKAGTGRVLGRSNSALGIS